MLSKKQAFTLVELIVVITILAILGTIAFMAFGGYSKNARDSVRISDLTSMVTSLELFETEKGFFPEPSHLFEITYSGSIAWTQGTFGESVLQNVASINEKPEDPLTGDEYAYSITNSKNEFQVATIFEGTNEIARTNSESNSKSQITFIPQTYAAESKGRLRVTLQGNYNGQFVKTNSGTTMYILGVPSIITSEIESVDILTILANKTLVYKGYSNLPASYAESGYTMTGGFDFGDTVEPLIYEGTQEELSDPIDPTARLILITNLKTLYNETVLETDGNLEQLIDTDIDIGSPSDEAKLLAASIVDNTMGTNIVQGLGNGGLLNGPDCSITNNELIRFNELMATGSILVRNGVGDELTPPLTEEGFCSIIELMWTGGPTIAPEIYSVDNLKILWIDYNQLTSIPSEVFDLISLEYLALGGNNFTELSPDIAKLTNLLELNIRRSYLSELPPELWTMTQLQGLYLARLQVGGVSGIMALAPEVSNLTNLKRFYLSDNNQITYPPELWTMTQLEYLGLRDANVQTLPQEVVNLVNLTRFNLGSNTALGELNFTFDHTTPNKSQINIPSVGQTMTIGGNGTNVVISITP